MKLLDLYCCGGGAARGYANSAFEVVGVDIKPQKRYPYEFHQADALEFLTRHGHEFDAIHASPPCQVHSAMTKGRWKDREHVDLIGATRELLVKIGKPYIIENVMGAKSVMVDPIMLCGTMFGLQTKEGSQLRRHRLFESNIPLELSANRRCQHNDGSAIGVYGGGQHPSRRRPATIGVSGNSGGSSTRDGFDHYGVDARREAMGITWLSGKELSQAIPPAYTEWLGRQLMAHILECKRGKE